MHYSVSGQVGPTATNEGFAVELDTEGDALRRALEEAEQQRDELQVGTSEWSRATFDVAAMREAYRQATAEEDADVYAHTNLRGQEEHSRA
jgi:hypothetical protein